jgi:hypothetical protein
MKLKPFRFNNDITTPFNVSTVYFPIDSVSYYYTSTEPFITSSTTIYTNNKNGYLSWVYSPAPPPSKPIYETDGVRHNHPHTKIFK